MVSSLLGEQKTGFLVSDETACRLVAEKPAWSGADTKDGKDPGGSRHRHRPAACPPPQSGRNHNIVCSMPVKSFGFGLFTALNVLF